MIRIAKPQHGMALVTALVMLVLLTLLAVTMIRSGTLNLRITQNMQLQQEAESAAQQTLEQVISNVNTFENPAASTHALDGFNIAVTRAECLGTQLRPGDSLAGEGNLIEGSAGATAGIELVDWELNATSTDATLGSGARVQISQGIRIEMLAGHCQ